MASRAKRARIELVTSNPCFEVWYRHHFEENGSSFENCAAAKRHVARLWGGYDVKPQSPYDQLRSRLDQARSNARRVRSAFGAAPSPLGIPNASTLVDRIFDEIELINLSAY